MYESFLEKLEEMISDLRVSSAESLESVDSATLNDRGGPLWALRVLFANDPAACKRSFEVRPTLRAGTTAFF